VYTRSRAGCIPDVLQHQIDISARIGAVQRRPFVRTGSGGVMSQIWRLAPSAIHQNECRPIPRTFPRHLRERPFPRLASRFGNNGRFRESGIACWVTYLSPRALVLACRSCNGLGDPPRLAKSARNLMVQAKPVDPSRPGLGRRKNHGPDQYWIAAIEESSYSLLKSR
jgi:hypothetical protein